WQGSCFSREIRQNARNGRGVRAHVKIGDQAFPNLLRKSSGFYWNAPPVARAAGFGSIPLGKELDDEALDRYLRAQKALARWREQKTAGDGSGPPAAGTVDWLLWDYFNHRWFTKLPDKTARDYRKSCEQWRIFVFSMDGASAHCRGRRLKH